jgi:hypothetical protein
MVKNNLLLIVYLGAIIYFLNGCQQSSKSTTIVTADEQHLTSIIHQLNNQLSEAIILGTFSPCAAARVYAYANIAAYEAAIQGSDSFISCSGQLKLMPVMPKPDLKNYIPEVALTVAFCTVGNVVVWHDYILDSAKTKTIRSLGGYFDKDKINYSIGYGDTLAATIIKWMNADGYSQTRKMPFYVPLKKEWSWEPTPPKFAEAIEPWWHTIHPLILDSASQFRAPGPPPFSAEKNTAFYNSALQVYNTSGKVMMNDTAIANFWDCNPFLTKREGHITYAVRQISPGGHWIGITQIACKLKNLNLQQSCEIYSLTAIALSEAFISCWETKYHYNLIRPQTYINRYINHNWNPLLETPPFPEYPSGHSVISSAAATVLENYFGNNFSYTDSVEVTFGKAPRHFTSFTQASEEAAISRNFGGIHYMEAIEDGKKEGRQVGEWEIAHLKTHR